MTTIALFGGSGRSGQQFIPLALQRGYRVKALARAPEKIKQKSENLEVIQGDVLTYPDVERLVKGSDVIVSLLGQVKGSPRDLQTNGTQNIVSAANATGKQRILSLSGGGLPFEKDEPKLADNLIRGAMRLFVPHILEDAKGHANVLRTSNLEWTIIRAPRLTNDEAKGNYKVGWVGQTGGTKISRADLAQFIMEELEQKRFDQQMPFVTN